MSGPNLHFTREEFASRIAKTRAAMDAANLDLLIISDPSNMAWLTGYDGWSFYVHQAVLLSMEGEPVWWGRQMDASGAKRTAFMHHDNIVGYEDTYVQNPEKHPMEDLARHITARGGDDGRIGVPKSIAGAGVAGFFKPHRIAGLNQQSCDKIKRLL